jgi:adenylosuccinate lyase
MAISPIDGRYFKDTSELSLYFSEFALIHYRVRIEVEYFIRLTHILPELADFPKPEIQPLVDLYKNFKESDAAEIKEIEKTTNHDVKAVEYFIKKHFEQRKLDRYKEFIHFGLTSQDINNTAIPLAMKEFMTMHMLPLLEKITNALAELADRWQDVPMLARTHGQPASPTRLGKEIKVFMVRLSVQYQSLIDIPYSAKFGGATGNFNAHHVAYPQINWIEFADNFVYDIGLELSYPTTQIEHYDNFAAQCDAMKRINTILIDFSRDVWQYVSLNYFKQRIKEGEVGSSAMPHKVNPIDFENAEGNLGFANALFEHLAAKLPISRLQRDLTDSTVLRNVGVPMAHAFVGYLSLLKGIGKLELNRKAIDDDLSDNWAVIAEAIQTILRKEGYPNPYEALKELTRKNEKITEEGIAKFIGTLEVSKEVKDKLRGITPFNYTGI